MSQIDGTSRFPNDGLNAAASPWLVPVPGTATAFPAGSPGNARFGLAADGVKPAWFGGDVANAAAWTAPGAVPGGDGGASIGGILARLASIVQQYIARLGTALTGRQADASTAPAATFQNVTLASVGDPHLAISGTALHADGGTAAVDSHFDSMTAHADLFSTGDFGDGFTVSTAVTQPGANGVTQNASATASMDGGMERVTMTAGGGVSIVSGGAAVAIAPNQTVRLANGATVSEAADGSVSINETSYGTSLTTTFAQNGSGGVDVTATGSNVTLAGDLLGGGSTPAAQAPADVRRTLAAWR